MPFRLQSLATIHPVFAAGAAALSAKLDHFESVDRPTQENLWSYYRNVAESRTVAADESGSERPYMLAQERGLPSRITGARQTPSGAIDVEGVSRKEIVVENDIGWRIDTQIDFLFGRAPTLTSQASDPRRKAVVAALLEHILDAAGGVLLWQKLSLLGAVYGYVDVIVKCDASPDASGAAEVIRVFLDSPPTSDVLSVEIEEAIEVLASCVRLEVAEPARSMPLLDGFDASLATALIQIANVETPASIKRHPRKPEPKWWRRVFGQVLAGTTPFTVPTPEFTTQTSRELIIHTANAWQRYSGDVLLDEGVNALGRLSIVHIQNTPAPFEYAGRSDVEPLVPLQDELNTRLSDRAYRIAMQSAKMYLGKGIENFESMPVSPGRMWVTDNLDASITEFGGDTDSPSEARHIEEIREAMDKISGVSPVASGAIKDRIGNLTSAAALRVTLLALLARTQRKRTSYGRGIEQLCELSLAWLDVLGLFNTTAVDRRVNLHWPDPLPQDEAAMLEQAKAKQAMGIASSVIQDELGY